jgi:hypothetical protein
LDENIFSYTPLKSCIKLDFGALINPEFLNGCRINETFKCGSFECKTILKMGWWEKTAPPRV